MKLRRPGLWLGIASALLVTLLVWSDRRRDSPGPVSATHAQDPSLAERGCERCHGRGSESMTSACATCHTDIGAEIREKKGFHGRLAADPDACEACHLEHHGRDFPLVGAQSFARAGVADRNAYDHAGLEFKLSGRHAKLACTDCHKEAEATVLAKGAKRFLGLDQACASCHEDVHGGKLPDCAACHGEEHPFAKVASFVHTTAFALTGAHARPACTDCHPKGSAHAIETDKTAVSRACEDCHASPHAKAFLTAAACVDCHPTTHASFAVAQAILTKKQHAASGFALVAPHDNVSCDACHKVPHANFREAYPGRSPDDCRSCHADPHAGQFAKGLFAGEGCLACHERTRFEPTTFDLAAHARTAFPLTGSHAAVPCSGCHANSAKGIRAFHGTETACRACHADPHVGQFAAGVRTDCARCHTSAESFERIAFDHDRDSRFHLDEGHKRLACAACHVRVPLEGGESAVRYKPLGMNCADCHEPGGRRPR